MAQLNEYTYLSQVSSLLLIIIIYYLIIKVYILPKIIQRSKVYHNLTLINQSKSNERNQSFQIYL